MIHTLRNKDPKLQEARQAALEAMQKHDIDYEPVRHKAHLLTTAEVEANRSNAYRYLEFPKLKGKDE